MSSFRRITSLSILFCFSVVLITGILQYFQPYDRLTATLHTLFATVFSVGIACHLLNNLKPLNIYIKTKSFLLVILIIGLFFFSAFVSNPLFNSIMDNGARLKAGTGRFVDQSSYQMIHMNLGRNHEIVIDLLRGPHYWHPQMAVWIEDIHGTYIETLFISKATAQGLFYGGRSKDNFKSFDSAKDVSGEVRRVNPLPIWSHKRNIQYSDGMYVPTVDTPMPDAITGATITDNFKLHTGISDLDKMILKIELNVAFDDNEYYSEYDFPDDEIFHSGTGQLGQPSILFATEIDMNDDRAYYLMDLVGHGHQSGQTGDVYDDLSTLTTAKQIVERIIVGVH